MKIGLVSPFSFSYPGGVQEHVKALCTEFKRKGHKVKIIVPRQTLTEDYGKDVILMGWSIEIPSNQARSNLSFCFKPLTIPKMLKKENFDILHFHNMGPFISLQILLASKSVNVFTIHSFPEASKTYKTLAPVFDWFAPYISKKIGGIISVSKVAEKTIPKDYKGLRTIIPNGIDLTRFDPKNPKIKKYSDDKLNILYVGLLVKRKGLPYLLRAFLILQKKFDNLRLIIVSDGPMRKECESLAKKLGLRNVEFEGFVDEKTIPNYYATADIFCSPATGGESFGIVLLEAMASGKPVVAFANEGYKQVLTGEGNRFLVPPKNTKLLAKTLESLIENKNLREKMGRWGIEEANKYSWERVADNVLKFYDDVVREVESLK